MTDASAEYRRFTARREPSVGSEGGTIASGSGPVILVIRMVSGTEFRIRYELPALARIEALEIIHDLNNTFANRPSTVRRLTLDGGREVQIVLMNVESMEIIPVDDAPGRGVSP